MKQTKLFKDFISEDNYPSGSSKKQPIVEANADGTISDDEEILFDDLLGEVEIQIDELIQYAKTEAYEIGGGFRGPGMTSELKKLMVDKLKRMKN